MLEQRQICIKEIRVNHKFPCLMEEKIKGGRGDGGGNKFSIEEEEKCSFCDSKKSSQAAALSDKNLSLSVEGSHCEISQEPKVSPIA